MGMLLQRHYANREALVAALRNAQIAEVEAARIQQANIAVERAQAAQEADEVPCAACADLLGVRPCSVECYVKAGYPADSYDAFIARIEAELVATEAKAKAEADAAAAAELEAKAASEAAAKAEVEAKAAEEVRQAEAAAAEAAKTEADRKAAEAAELAALEEATRPDESKSESKRSKK